MKKEISKKLLVLFITLVLFLGLQFAGGIVMAADVGPETIEMKSPVAHKPARFTHRKHQESFACSRCHHTRSDTGTKLPYEAGMQVKKCIACHNKDEMTNLKLNSLKLAAHGLCKECHKQHKGSAPTTCSGCHIKLNL